jgi:hypothetical protein
MPREKFCQCEEDGIPCGQQLSGRGAWKFCSDCRGPVMKQAKSQRNKAYYDDLKEPRNQVSLEHHRAVIRYARYRNYHHLTGNQLEPLVARAEALRKQYSEVGDDFHESIANDILKINDSLRNPHAGLVSTAEDAREAIVRVLAFLTQKKQASPHDHNLSHLILSALELKRDIAIDVSSEAFTALRTEAKVVREKMLEHGELARLIVALLAEVELARLQFLAIPDHPDRWKFLTHAEYLLDAAKHVCAYFAKRRKSAAHKQIAALLAFHVPSLEGQLACDRDEQNQPTNSIQELKQCAKVTAEHGINPAITDTVKFTCAIYQSQFYIHFNKITCAERYFNKAKQIFKKPMQYRSIESELEVSYVKARLALAKRSQDREEHVHEYALLFQHHPFLTHYNHLQTLERLYPEDVSESLFQGVQVYFDTMFRRLQPFLLPISDIKAPESVETS